MFCSGDSRNNASRLGNLSGECNIRNWRTFLAGTLLVGCAAHAQTPQLARFTVEVHTQGDTLRDSVTGELLDCETPRAKAFQCITIEVQDSKPVGNATFVSPPWAGSNGTPRKSSMGGQSGEGLRGR